MLYNIVEKTCKAGSSVMFYKNLLIQYNEIHKELKKTVGFTFVSIR